MSKKFEIVGQDMSDGFHTFDDLYLHRNGLFIMLCVQSGDAAYWKSDGAEWFVLFLDTMRGQISYHISARFLHMVAPLISERPDAVWDGHTSGDVLTRLGMCS